MKKIISICLTVCLICTLCINIFASEMETPKLEDATKKPWETPDNIYNKLHFYFGDEDLFTIDDAKEMNEAFSALKSSDDAKVNAYGVTSDTTIDVTVQFASEISETKSYFELVARRAELNTLEEVHEWRAELNSYSNEYHNKLISENIMMLKELKADSYEIIRYSPCITLKMEMEDVELDDFTQLIESENISHISFDYTIETAGEMSWNEALDEIHASTIVGNAIYTGDGVRIGVYEAGGIVDVTHTSLQGIDITINDFSHLDPEKYHYLSSHATVVTAIIYQMAPDAKYFYNQTPASNRSLEWFIDNGCDVVNCSWGTTSATPTGEMIGDDIVYAAATTNGYKMHVDGLYDYQIQHHFITVVKSAGNYNNTVTSSSYNPNGLISNPGYAYNVITVGGVEYDSTGDLVHRSKCSYVSGSSSRKPNVSAPAAVYVPGIGNQTGTSIATPQVTASIALLLERKPQLCSYPEIIMSIVTASANETDDYSEDDGSFDTKVGAGVIDTDSIVYYDYYNTAEQDPGTTSNVFSINVYLNSGDILQVGTSWLVRVSLNSSGNPSQVHFTDYDLELRGPNGNIVSYSIYGNDSNVEFIRYQTPSSGQYTIVVNRYNNFTMGADNVDYLAIAYNIK